MNGTFLMRRKGKRPPKVIWRGKYVSARKTRSKAQKWHVYAS